MCACTPPHDSKLRFGTEVGAVLGIDTIAVRCLGVVVMCAPAVSAIGEATDGDGDEVIYDSQFVSK